MIRSEIEFRSKRQTVAPGKVEAGPGETNPSNPSKKDRLGLSKTRGIERISLADYYRSTFLGVGPGNG